MFNFSFQTACRNLKVECKNDAQISQVLPFQLFFKCHQNLGITSFWDREQVFWDKMLLKIPLLSPMLSFFRLSRHNDTPQDSPAALMIQPKHEKWKMFHFELNSISSSFMSLKKNAMHIFTIHLIFREPLMRSIYSFHTHTDFSAYSERTLLC